MSTDRVNPISPIPSNQNTNNDKLPSQDTPSTDKSDDSSSSDDSSTSGDGISRDKDGNYTGVDKHV